MTAVRLLADLVQSLRAASEMAAELARHGLVDKPSGSTEEIRLLVREELARASRTRSDDGLLTASEAAQRANVTAATIRDWIRTNRLKASLAGTRWRIRPEDLTAAMSAPRRHASEEAEIEERAAQILQMHDARQRRA